MSTMNGKVVLISGAGSGIGAHTARLLADSRARAVLLDRKGAAAERETKLRARSIPEALS